MEIASNEDEEKSAEFPNLECVHAGFHIGRVDSESDHQVAVISLGQKSPTSSAITWKFKAL